MSIGSEFHTLEAATLNAHLAVVSQLSLPSLHGS